MKIRTPENVSDIWHFLILYNQLSMFVPTLADKANPFRDLIPKNCPWTWELPQLDALEKQKNFTVQYSSPGIG